ncbi:SEL1-like repeat protein [Aeromonas veronii]|nr:SEL1-like repeat protein [Aeromonas veronii]
MSSRYFIIPYIIIQAFYSSYLMAQTQSKNCNEKSFSSILQEAEGGNVSAQINVGEMYGLGRGIYPDRNRMLHWYKKAAVTGNVEAKLILARKYIELEDYDQAIIWLNQAVDLGDPTAKSLLAIMYLLEQGVIKNPKRALSLYKEAANENELLSLVNLGLIYEEGEIVPKDDNQAQSFFNKAKMLAKERNDANSQLILAYIHEKYGDKEQTLSSYYKAAELGSADAEYYIANAYIFGIGTSKNEEQAIYWYNKSAKHGNKSAQFELVKMHYFYKNYKQAYFWLSVLAANISEDDKLGNELSYYRGRILGRMTEDTIISIDKSVIDYFEKWSDCNNNNPSN